MILAAIRALLTRDRQAAREALVSEWARTPGAARHGELPYSMTHVLISEAGTFDGSDSTTAAENVLALIYLGGGPGPIQAVAASFGDKPLWARRAMIDQASPEAMDHARERGEIPLPPAGERPAMKSALESLLVSGLDQREERLCDRAAAILHERWPEKYAFKETESLRERDTQILAINNTWRSAHGLPILPAPASVVIPRAAAAQIDPLLQALIEAKDHAGIQAAIDALASQVGLSALAPLAEHMDALPAISPLRERFQQAASQLACLVREVQVDAGAPPFAACPETRKLQGQVLNPGTLKHLLVALFQATPGDATKFAVTAAREGDGTGFVVVIHLGGAKYPAELNDWWSEYYAGHEYQAVGDQNRGLYGTRKIGQSPEDFGELIHSFTEATADWKRPTFVDYQASRQMAR